MTILWKIRQNLSKISRRSFRVSSFISAICFLLVGFTFIIYQEEKLLNGKVKGEVNWMSKEDNIYSYDDDDDAAVFIEVLTKTKLDSEIILTFVLCDSSYDDKTKADGGEEALNIERQLNQSLVMCKSAIALTTSHLRFLVLTDSTSLYQTFLQLIKKVNRNSWSSRVTFENQPIWYPQNRPDIRSIFRACSTERLFIPKLINERNKEIVENGKGTPIHSLIYVDTDIIFMRSPQILWQQFRQFGKTASVGMSPSFSYYGMNKPKIPFFRPSGLQAGVMLMNISRLNQFPGGWMEENLKIFDTFKSLITWADQDILNILFEQHRSQLHQLPCEWNFRAVLCTRRAIFCASVLQNGVNVIHGNDVTFFNEKEIKLQVIYESWRDFDMSQNLSSLFDTMRMRLGESDRKFPSKFSPCSSIDGIDNFLTKGLQKEI